MKKNTLVIAALLLCTGLLLPASAMANENSTANASMACNCSLTDDDVQQVWDFNSLPGAEYRFLQLEKSITRNILVGSAIIEVVEKNHPDANTSIMVLAVDDLEELLNETKAINLSDMEPSEVASTFVEIKKESINLTQEFRSEALKYVNATDRQEIASKLSGLNETLFGMHEMIRNARMQLNAFRLNNTIGCMNLTNQNMQQLVEMVRNGNATLDQVRAEIRNAFAGMNQTWKIDSLKQLKSCDVQRVQLRKELKEGIEQALPQRIMTKSMQMASNRIAKQAQELSRISNRFEVKSMTLTRTGNTALASQMQNISNQMQVRSQEMQNWSQKLQETINERIRNRTGR